MATTFTEIISKGSKNRLLNTEDFTQASWTKSNATVTANLGPDPLGGTTADQISDASGSIGQAYREIPASELVVGDPVSFSVYLSKGTAAQSAVTLSHAGLNPICSIVITWGATAGDTPSYSKSATGANLYTRVDLRRAANNTWRCTTTFLYTGSGNVRCSILPAGLSGAAQGTVYAWGAQAELYQCATEYQSIGASDPLVGTYRTIESWVSAHNAEDLTTTGNQYIGQLRDETYTLTGANSVVFSNPNTTSSANRILTYVPASGPYDPVTNTGPRIVMRFGTTGTSNGIRINGEDHVRIYGIGLFVDPNTRTTSGTHSMVSIEGDDFRMWSCFLRCKYGGGDTSSGNDTFQFGILVGAADDTRIFNTIIAGGGSGRTRGLDSGIYWQSASSLGGVYNCAIYGVAAHGTGDGISCESHSPTTNAPELVNTIICECADAFVGIFRRLANIISSDTVPDEATASKGRISANTVWIAPETHDFRLRGGAVALNRGSPETSKFATASGGPGSVDFVGNSRGATWDVGPFEGAGVAIATDFSVVSKTVGLSPDRDYGSIAGFLAALPRSLYATNQRWVASCYQDAGVDEIARTCEFAFFDCITSAGNAIEVSGAEPIEPRSLTGYRIRAQLDVDGDIRHRAVLYSSADFTEFSNIIVEQKTSSGDVFNRNARGVEVLGHFNVVKNVAVFFDGTTARPLSVGIEFEGDHSKAINCLVRGTTTQTGATRGFAVSPDCIGVEFLHCVSYRISSSSATFPAYGFLIGLGCSRYRISGCVAMETAGVAGDSDFGDFVNPTTGIDHSISGDTTATGFACQTSKTAGQVFNAAASDDFRLPSTSLALDAGGNLTSIFTEDISGTRRFAPFDIGLYEGILHTTLRRVPTPRSIVRLGVLWEIVRKDGAAFYFCSMNEPYVFKGRTYLPAAATSAAARRIDSGLRESSTEVVGAVVSDVVTAEDLAAKLYDGAQVKEYQVDWRYPWTTPYRTRSWRVSNIQHSQDQWTLELVGPSSVLQQRVGETIGVDCPYQLGDSDCGIFLPALTQVNVAVSSVADARREFSASSLSAGHPDDYFAKGKFVWNTGNNAGIEFEVKTYTQSTRTIRLLEKAPFDISVSDTFNISPGCRRRYVLDCITKFSNGRNFGGNPYVGSTDDALETPRR